MLKISQFTQLIGVATLAVGLSGCQVLSDLTTSSDADKVPAENAVETEAHNESAGETALTLAPVNDDPQQFLGQAGDEIDLALGAPDLVRRDGPAEVRQFRGRACTLDLFLYPVEAQALAVRHVELRGASLDGEGRRACLAELIRARTLSS